MAEYLANCALGMTGHDAYLFTFAEMDAHAVEFAVQNVLNNKEVRQKFEFFVGKYRETLEGKEPDKATADAFIYVSSKFLEEYVNEFEKLFGKRAALLKSLTKK